MAKIYEQCPDCGAVAVDDVGSRFACGSEATNQMRRGTIDFKNSNECVRRVLEQMRQRTMMEDCRIQQMLGRVLGYPKFSDDSENFPGVPEHDPTVCVGAHTALTIAAEAADRLHTLQELVRDIAIRTSTIELENIEDPILVSLLQFTQDMNVSMTQLRPQTASKVVCKPQPDECGYYHCEGTCPSCGSHNPNQPDSDNGDYENGTAYMFVCPNCNVKYSEFSAEQYCNSGVLSWRIAIEPDEDDFDDDGDDVKMWVSQYDGGGYVTCVDVNLAAIFDDKDAAQESLDAILTGNLSPGGRLEHAPVKETEND